jgi:diaminopimelate epimerase
LMSMQFTKYEATGNDFIIIDGTRRDPDLSAGAVRLLCRRRKGVGADGVVVMLPSVECDVRMRIFNADGTEAEMCGNGIRALFLFAIERGAVEGNRAVIETVAGNRTVTLAGDGCALTVEMGKPAYKRSEVPMLGPPEEEAVDVDIPMVDGELLRGTCVSMGNPHCVIFVDGVKDYPLSTVGPAVENLGIFPERTNVESVEVSGNDRLIARVWERGVGETLSCGTGACASMVAANLVGRVGSRATVTVPGGELEVRWETGGVLLTGTARRVYDGETVD